MEGCLFDFTGKGNEGKNFLKKGLYKQKRVWYYKHNKSIIIIIIEN